MSAQIASVFSLLRLVLVVGGLAAMGQAPVAVAQNAESAVTAQARIAATAPVLRAVAAEAEREAVPGPGLAVDITAIQRPATLVSSVVAREPLVARGLHLLRPQARGPPLA